MTSLLLANNTAAASLVAVHGYFTALLVLDYLSDIVFVLDSRLRSAAFAYLEGDTVISEKEKIKANYAKYRVPNILSVVPIEVLCFASTISPFTTVQIFSLLRSLRLLRIQHFPEHLRCADHTFHLFTENKKKNALKVFKLISLIVLCAHWIGCVWHMIAFVEESDGQPNWADCRSRWAAARSAWNFRAERLCCQLRHRF